MIAVWSVLDKVRVAKDLDMGEINFKLYKSEIYAENLRHEISVWPQDVLGMVSRGFHDILRMPWWSVGSPGSTGFDGSGGLEGVKWFF